MGWQSFNRINSGRSIPTMITENMLEGSFIGFNRINSGRSIPTICLILLYSISITCFNRINSGRSIPTVVFSHVLILNVQFQSYQFRQINPDYVIAGACLVPQLRVSIVSIQADQSRLN